MISSCDVFKYIFFDTRQPDSKSKFTFFQLLDIYKIIKIYTYIKYIVNKSCYKDTITDFLVIFTVTKLKLIKYQSIF